MRSNKEIYEALMTLHQRQISFISTRYHLAAKHLSCWCSIFPPGDTFPFSVAAMTVFTHLNICAGREGFLHQLQNPKGHLATFCRRRCRHLREDGGKFRPQPRRLRGQPEDARPSLARPQLRSAFGHRHDPDAVDHPRAHRSGSLLGRDDARQVVAQLHQGVAQDTFLSPEVADSAEPYH